MVSDYRVAFLTEAGTMTVTTDVLSVTVSDGLGDQMPQGSIRLPLKRNTRWGREPYSTLVRPGDVCTVQVLASYGRGETWSTILDGVVRSVAEEETLNQRGREVSTTVEVGSFADILNEDTVAWWMFYGSLEGWARTRAYLTADQMTQAPYKVAFDFLTRVAMVESVYNNLGVTLANRVHLALNGLEAISTLELSLSMIEGPHWQIISGFMDNPIHELYAATLPPEDLPKAGRVRKAGTPGTSDEGATAVIMRAAPYVYADEGGNAVADEWNALPVHTLDDVTPIVDRRGGTFTKAAVRNFTIVYPAYQFLDEQFVYAYGAAIANRVSIARFGYRPLKVRSHLIINDNAEQSDIIAFMHQLSYRVAGQWNMMQMLKNGVVNTTLAPWVRPGQRVRFRDPWTSEQEYEYHVRGRQITIDPVQGARMSLAVERGAPVKQYANPGWLVENLTMVRAGAEQYAVNFRGQDTPGSPQP